MYLYFLTRRHTKFPVQIRRRPATSGLRAHPPRHLLSGQSNPPARLEPNPPSTSPSTPLSHRPGISPPSSHRSLACCRSCRCPHPSPPTTNSLDSSSTPSGPTGRTLDELHLRCPPHRTPSTTTSIPTGRSPPPGPASAGVRDPPAFSTLDPRFGRRRSLPAAQSRLSMFLAHTYTRLHKFSC